MGSVVLVGSALQPELGRHGFHFKNVAQHAPRYIIRRNAVPEGFVVLDEEVPLNDAKLKQVLHDGIRVTTAPELLQRVHVQNGVAVVFNRGVEYLAFQYLVQDVVVLVLMVVDVSVHTLEAAIWLLFRYNGFRSTALAAVNLGSDMDTTTAVVGPLAALVDPHKNEIPTDWLSVLARREEIKGLAKRFTTQISELGFD